MPTVDVLDKSGQKVGQVELSDEVFGRRVPEHLFWEVVRAQLAKRRAGTASTKGRSEVSGSTRKLYRQKGTGRARHGDRKAPIFVGGGTVHGPKPRSYELKVPKKVRRAAMCGALSLKVAEGRLVVLQDFELERIKTKDAVEVLDTVAQGRVLVVDRKDNDKLRLSTRNLPSALFLPPEGLNVYDVLRHDTLVITLDAVKAVDEKLSAPVRAR